MIVMSHSNVFFHVEILNKIAPVIPGENPCAWGGVFAMIAGSRGFNHYRITRHETSYTSQNVPSANDSNKHTVRRFSSKVRQLLQVVYYFLRNVRSF